MSLNKDSEPKVTSENFRVVPHSIKVTIDNKKAAALMRHLGLSNPSDYKIIFKSGIQFIYDKHLYGTFDDRNKEISIYPDAIWDKTAKSYWRQNSLFKETADNADEGIISTYASILADRTLAHELRHAKQSSIFERKPRIEIALWGGTAVGVGLAVNKLIPPSKNKLLKNLTSLGAAAATLLVYPYIADSVRKKRRAYQEKDALQFEEEFKSLKEFHGIVSFTPNLEK